MIFSKSPFTGSVPVCIPLQPIDWVLYFGRIFGVVPLLVPEIPILFTIHVAAPFDDRDQVEEWAAANYIQISQHARRALIAPELLN